MPSRRTVRRLSVVALAGLAVAIPLGRAWALQWGATDDDLDAALPGDEFIPDPEVVATRGITIDAPASEVWAWLVQIGQDRGGFYSYDWLENLIGLNIHSADQIEERWQSLAPGDPVRLGSAVAMDAAVVDPGHTLVLVAPEQAFTWTFALLPGRDRTTRLVVRERFARLGWWSRPVNEAIATASAVMTRAMLRGIRDRAETTTAR